MCGSVGEITGWNWKSMLAANKNPKPAWTIILPTTKDNLEKSDVNCMLFDEKTNLLYAGCGDNCIYVLSLEDGRLVRTLEAHDDYIHSVHVQ